MSRRAHLFDLDRIGAELPVANAKRELTLAAQTGVMVVSAPPGTGKTTYVPALIANLLHGRVLLTEPRRVAVRAAARRIAELDGTQIGGAVGYTVRGERQISASTQIEVLTPGVLLRRLLSDPILDGISAVILDEVHERSVDSDLLLGMLSEVRELREDLLIVAMSATLDTTRFVEILGTSADSIVQVPSALHPLEISFAPFAAPRLDRRGVSRGYLAHLARVAVEEQQRDGCDALVFVPGAREVDEVVRLIQAGAQDQSRGSAELEVLPLHGRISAKEQDMAVRGGEPSGPPRIVVSTSLAESSLTVPGVRLVIDSGLSREVRRDQGRDMTGLVTVSASRASAEQRAGRAARQCPGRAVRAYSESDFAHMPKASAPEIASADLTDAALLLAVWGTPGGRGLRLPTPPPELSMSSAVRVLTELELVDTQGRPTVMGQRVAQLPVGVREARALLDGAKDLHDTLTAAEIVAAISDDHRDAGADLTSLLRDLKSGRAPGATRWKHETARLERLLNGEVGRSNRDEHHVDAPGIVTALARPEWVARRTAKASRSYLLASGTRAALPEGSALQAHEWIAVNEVQRAEGFVTDGTGAVIRMAAPLTEESAFRVAAPLMRNNRSASIEDGRVRVREERWLGDIRLSSTPATPRAEDSAHAFETHVRAAGLTALNWTETAISIRARLSLLHRILGEPWPDVRDEALITTLEIWLGPDLDRLLPNSSLGKIEVAQALRRLLPWPDASRFEELVPEQLLVPSGSHVRITYPEAEGAETRPIVAIKLQEVFGLAETPRLVAGRVPVLFHLLSPARKPLAVTDDLSSFWNGPYKQVRAEMRGRYPKHPWPEDPWSAQATARTKRRSDAR